MKKLTPKQYNKMKTEQLVIKSQLILLFMRGKEDQDNPFTTYFKHDGLEYVGLNFSPEYPDPHSLTENFFFKVTKCRGRYKFYKVDDPKELLDEYEHQILMDDLWQYHEDEGNYSNLPKWHPLYDENGKSQMD